MAYKVEVPGRVKIGTARNIQELPNILYDGDCEKRMTVDKISRIADYLIERGKYIGRFAGDTRFTYTITKTV